MARWKPRLSIAAADTVWLPALGRSAGSIDADDPALGPVLNGLCGNFGQRRLVA